MSRICLKTCRKLLCAVRRGVADSSRRWFVLRRQTVSVFFVLFIVIRACKARDVSVV